MVKVYLSRKGLDFKEYNVSLDPEAVKRLIGMGYRTTPVTVIGMSGSSATALRSWMPPSRRSAQPSHDFFPPTRPRGVAA